MWGCLRWIGRSGSWIRSKDGLGAALRDALRWDYALPYGIFSRTATRDVAAAFLDFIHKTYTGDNPDDIVPVLSY